MSYIPELLEFQVILYRVNTDGGSCAVIASAYLLHLRYSTMWRIKPGTEAISFLASMSF